MPQVLSYYLSNLTSHTKSLFSCQEEPTPAEDIGLLAFVFVRQERLHRLDQLPYVHNSMLPSIQNACQTMFIEEKDCVRLSKGCAGQEGVALAGHPAVVWQVLAL